MKRYRFSLKDLMIAILLTALVSTSAQLSYLWSEPQSQKFTQLESPYIEILPKANAQTSTASSVSPNHKGFDGGWIIPFEVFDLSVTYYKRGVYWTPRYNKKPVRVDLNGDGLLDLIFSTYDPVSNENSSSYATGFSQYVKLQRPNGSFETVYTCSQSSFVSSNTNSGTTYGFKYHGHCADTVNTTDPGNTKRWEPSIITLQLGNIGSLQSGDDRLNLLSSIRYTEENHDYDRNAATFIDINGDGLQDMVFGGSTTLQKHATNGSARSASAILYNNGNGFDVGLFVAD
ncbi:MAG: hypothetical protein P1V18_05065 [Candidatus Gracilibacteria bacterium]|nr:hypothetical protein [Candidatus Gracilibacteria bacterium]